MTIDKVLILTTAIIKNKKGEILLLQRGNTKTFQAYWQLPEGKLEEKEQPGEALRREIKEEISQEVTSSKLFSAVATPLEAKGVYYMAFRMIFEVNIADEKITLSHEHANYQWILPEDVSSLDLLPGTLEALTSLNK